MVKEKNFERRQALLEAALEEFTVKNFDEASLNTIIKTAGVSKGNFYYHYQNKQELYLALMEEVSRLKVDFLHQWSAKHAAELTGKDIFEILKMQGKAGLEFAAEYPKYYQLGRNFTLEKNTKIKEAVKERMGSSTEQYLKQMVEGAMQRGEIRRDFPEDFVQRLLVFLFTNFDQIFLKNIEDFDMYRIIEDFERYMDFLKNGLAKV